MNKKLLFCSIAFPPKNDPECIQTGRYFKYLHKNTDFDIQVLTSTIPTLFMDKDESLFEMLDGFTNLVEIPIYENKYLNFLIRKVDKSLLEKPDSKFTFHKQWKKAVRKITRPDIIYSRSYPLSSTIMGYKLAEFYNVPWILHLSDPWSDSPLHKFDIKELEWHAKWEKNVLC